MRPQSAWTEPTALEFELGGLLDALPESLEQLLDHPERHRPAVVERLIAKGWELLEQHRWQAYYVADAARLVAAELPVHLPREVRFGLRARSLELWGTLQRVVGEPAVAEAALLSAIELLAQTELTEPRHLAVLLGRCALLASDGDREEDLARYATEVARVAKAADRCWPLTTFEQLWQTLMKDPKSSQSAVRLAKALFRAVQDSWGGFDDQPWKMSLEIIDRGEAGYEIRLDRQSPLPGLPSWTPDEPLVCYCRDQLPSV